MKVRQLDELAVRVMEEARKEGWWKQGITVLAAVSGGPEISATTPARGSMKRCTSRSGTNPMAAAPVPPGSPAPADLMTSRRSSTTSRGPDGRCAGRREFEEHRTGLR